MAQKKTKTSWRHRLKNLLTIRKQLVRESMTEFIGTFTFITMGDASVAMLVLGGHEYGGFLSVNWAWAVAVAFGVWITAGVSRGHINPAVTLTFCILGRVPWIKLPVYWFGQYMGAFMASVCIYCVYYDALHDYDGGFRQVIGPQRTAGIFATYPQDFLTTEVGLFNKIVATAVFLCVILSLTDKHSRYRPSTGMFPLVVGLIVFVLGMAFGSNCGYAINPARDLCPRLFTLMSGWGMDTFREHRYWFWVPLVGSHVGAVTGALTYQLFVGVHSQQEEENEEEDDESPDLTRAGTAATFLQSSKPSSVSLRTSDICGSQNLVHFDITDYNAASSTV